MKKVIAIATIAVMAAVAAPALAGSNGGNGCGVGSPPRVDMTHEQKLNWNPPFFTRRGEGRSDSRQKNAHNECVADRSNQ